MLLRMEFLQNHIAAAEMVPDAASAVEGSGMGNGGEIHHATSDSLYSEAQKPKTEKRT